MPGPADKAKIMQALNAGGDLTRTIKIYDETDEYEYLKSSKGKITRNQFLPYTIF